jgi:peptidoglycan/LPS O-acetylase OafA/YrhL
MPFAFLLFCLLALLIGVLVWRKVPRQHAFWIALASAWIYGISFFLTLDAVHALAPSRTEGFLPYFFPILAVGIFVAWAVRRLKVIEELNRKV